MSEKELRYEFGDNWRSFVENALNEERIQQSVKGLSDVLRRDSLEGLIFLDIGCGSGLSSLAACKLGAAKVIGFDYDASSVAASKEIRRLSNISEDKWTITQGSALDKDFLSGLGKADIVYSWGVLHHTGDMWTAIDNASQLVKPGGLFSIAIYNKVDGRKGSSMWVKIKKTYNLAPPLLKKIMEYIYISLLIMTMLKGFRNPVKVIAQYSKTSLRGMDFFHDARDWLGGYPFEYATAGEVFNYVKNRHGMQLVYLNTFNGHTCNELTFMKPE